MSRVFRRIVSFLLGFVMGISAVAGALVGGAYWAYKNVSLKKVGLEQDGLGDVNEITIEEALDLFMNMSENPQNYSIKDFEEKYGFDLELILKNFNLELKKETADDKANVEALKNINLAYLFSNNGLEMFLDTISPRVLFNWLPDSILSYGTRARLSQYSLKDLIKTDSVTGNLGIIDALATVKLGGLFPSLYTENYDKNVHSYVYTSTDTEKAYLELLGNFNIGSLIASFTDKDTNFLNEFLSGRMTDVSQKSVDQLLYELMSSFNTDLAETVRDYAKTLGGKSISDLFIYTEEGNYKFSPENLLKGIKLGYVVGLTEKNGQWYDGDKKADGIKSLIASFSVGSLYDAIKSGKKSGNVSQAILDNLTYQLGDLSIGTFLAEFMGYEQNEQGKWVAPEGKKTLNLLSCLGGISVKGILGGNGTIVENLLKTLKDSFEGYRVGDFVSDFVDIQRTENGKWTQNGKEINKLLNGVYEIEINSLIKDKYDLQSVILVLKDAIGEVAVGDIMGYNCDSGKWFNGTEEVDKKIALVCDVKISNVLDIFLSDFSLTSIVKCITGELTVGDILETYLDFNYDETTGVYYNSKNKETVPALYKLRNVKLWQLVAPFDKTSSYDLFAVLDQISLGDFLGERNPYDGRWTLTISFLKEELRLNGAFNKVLDINLGKLLDPAVDAEEILAPLKDCTFGEIFQSATFMSYDEIGGEWESKFINKIYNFMEVLAEIPSTVNDLIKVIKGETEVEPFLKKTLGGVRLGDLIADILNYSYFGYGGSGFWINEDGESYNLYNVLFDYLVIDDTYDIINDSDKLETIKSLTGILEIGDFLAPFTSFDKQSGVWTNGGNKILLVLSDVFSVRISYILSVIQNAIKGDKIQVKEVVENVCGRSRSLGDYVKDFLPDDFAYKPLDIADNLIFYEFVDIVFDGNAKQYGFKDNYEYYTSLFGDLMIGDTFAEFINYSYDTANGIWQDGSKTDVYKILNAVMSVKFKFIMEVIDKAVNGKEIDISDTVKEVLGDNTIKYYTDDFFKIDNKAVDKILGINIPEFVDIIVEGKAGDHIGSDGAPYEDRVDYLTDVVEGIMVGDTFAQYVGYNFDETSESWKNADGSDTYRILNDLFKIKFAYLIREISDIINNKADLADLFEGIFGRDTTVGYYVEEFLSKSEYEPLKYLYDIGIREFVDVVLCGDATDNGYIDVKDYLIIKFGEFEIGELFGQFLNLSKGADGDWVNANGQKVKKILEVLLSINVYDTITFITDGDFSGEALSTYVKLNVGENETLGDLLNDLGLERLEGFRYEYVFKSNGKGIYRVMYEAFKINVVELAKNPAEYFTEFIKQYEFMDYIAMYGEFFGNYYDKNDKKWYNGEHEPANSGSMALMWTTLGLEGTIAFAIAYFCFNDWLVEQCGDKIVYDFIGDAINAVYDESQDVYKFADFEPVSEFWDLLLRTKAGQLCKKGFDFKGYFYESNVLTIGNVGGYYLQKFAFASFQVGYDYGLWEVKGDYAQTLSAILNFSLKDFIDSCKSKQAVEYLKVLFMQVQLGDFFTQAFGMESSADGWKKKDSYDYYKNLFRAFFDINIVNTIESIKTNTKNGVFYDEIYGDMFGRDKSIAYYFADFFNQTYNEEKGLWVNANEEVLYSWCQTVYDVNPYTFLHSLRENNLKTALEDTFGVILVGDLTYDLVAKVKFLELQTEKVGDKYVNSGEWIALADTVYNISVNDIVENAKKGSFWKEKFCNLYLGDYIASLIKKLLPKTNTESEITYKADGYEVSGDYCNLLTALFNIYIMDVSDSIKAKDFKAYITGDKALGNIKPVSDIVFNKGTLVYDEVNDLWRFNDGEIVPFDFSISSTVKKKIMKLTVNELANGFNYTSLLNDLYIGDVMGLSRDAQFKDGATTIYKFADSYYTLNSEGNKVKFPYEINVDDDGVWYYNDGENDHALTLENNEWFGTKVFENYYNVEITTDKNGKVTVTDYDTGKIYPVSYDGANDVYTVTFDAEEACFNVYNGVHFVAEHNGVFRRYKQSELIQRMSDIRVIDLLYGVDLNEIFGDVYVGHLLEYVQGDMSDDPENQYDYTNTYEKYKWYSDEGKQDRLDAINELVANICLGSVFDGTLDIYQEGQKLAIKDIVDVEDIPVLFTIQDVKVKDMGDAIRALYVGEVMEDEEIDVLFDEDGNYFYKSFDSEALYPYYTYSKNASGVYEYAYVNVRQDGGYYYENGSVRVDLQAKKVWGKTNRFSDLRYSVKDGYIYKNDVKVGALSPYGTRENAYVCNMNDSTKFYAISRKDAKGNLVYYKAIDETFLETAVTHVENTLLNVVAGIQLKELNKFNFSQTLINKITGEASIGEFFDREDTGILSLFTQKELNKTSISSFPDAIKNKVTTCGVGQMMSAGLVTISADKQAKLDAIFSAGTSVEWRNLPVNQFVDQLLDRITI